MVNVAGSIDLSMLVRNTPTSSPATWGWRWLLSLPHIVKYATVGDGRVVPTASVGSGFCWRFATSSGAGSAAFVLKQEA